jgi:hypothetical protein
MSSFKVGYTIIHIPTKSSSNEIKRFVVVFIPLQLILGRVVEHHQDHIHLLYDLPNSTTLTQKTVVSLVLSIIKILAIEGHKLDITFLHVTSGSQSMFKPTSDQTDSDTN